MNGFCSAAHENRCSSKTVRMRPIQLRVHSDNDVQTLDVHVHARWTFNMLFGQCP